VRLASKRSARIWTLNIVAFGRRSGGKLGDAGRVIMWTNARREHLECAAYDVGVRLAHVRPVGRGFQFRVLLGEDRLGDDADIEAGQRPTDRFYQRVSGDGSQAQWKSWDERQRRVGAVCWHGFRDFIRALYGYNQACTVRTSLATYRGDVDFERAYGRTRWGDKDGLSLTTSMECVCGDEE